jgi:gamma-glutamylcyclotransferase (GGCT)/AIG2-like uncharacterized protein YtfP
MPLLITYGTLQLEQVQLSTFGRLLAGEPDSLPGYEKTLVKIEDPEAAAAFDMTHYSSVRFTGNNASLVDGVVFDITGVELAAADEYERDGNYARVKATLASGKQAWVYVHISSIPEVGKPSGGER